MHLLQRFLDFIGKEKLWQPADRLLLAVSGGVDSVVLSALCRQAGFDFVIAHCNFQLRGEESMRDERFVEQLGVSLGVKVLVKRFDTERYAQQNKLSVQAAARALRYRWFYELVQEEFPETWLEVPADPFPSFNTAAMPVNAMLSADDSAQGGEKAPRFIVTAHHLDDNIETMMMNFFKGTGIAGLRGILPGNGVLARPLLFAPKADLLRFAKENNLDYVEDSSNASDKYTRNYFRNSLIPALQKVYPRVEDNLDRNLQRFREAEQLYRQAVALHEKKLLETKGNEVHIPVLKLKKTVPLETILYEITKKFGFTPHQVPEVMELLESGSGKFVQSALYRIIRNRNWLIISPVKTETAQTIVIGKNDRTIPFGNGRLEFREMPVAACAVTPAADTAQLDAEKLAFPLLLRKCRQGDYFYPLGMQKKKKLNRFLSDLKLSVTEKENTWVLEGDRKIIWIPGKRIDDRFKLTPHTTRVCQIRWITDG